ncbi:MAG: hypothetical protein AAF674_01190 [Pseudomonadota bacterium]
MKRFKEQIVESLATAAGGRAGDHVREDMPTSFAPDGPLIRIGLYGQSTYIAGHTQHLHAARRNQSAGAFGAFAAIYS